MSSFSQLCRSQHVRFALGLTACGLPLIYLTLAAGGCGSPNHTVAAQTQSAALLQGNVAHRAAILAGYQGFASGIAYPLTALKLVSPAGSAILTSGKAASITTAQTTDSQLTFASLSSAFRARSTTRQFSALNLTYLPALNLYGGYSTFNGNVLTLYYYSDSGGTQLAGTITMTQPSGVSGSNPDYPSYPAKVTIVVNLTAGNLPCNGTVVINFTGSSGKNTMTGTLSLPKSGTTYTVDLTLSDTLDISGSITGQENGATISLTNCSGNLFGTLNCDLTIAPYGWKGTATGSFVTGQFSTMVDTSSGISSSTVDASGDLVISYPDGTTETIDDPLVATLVAGNSASPSPSPSTGTPTPKPSPTPSPTPPSVPTAPTFGAPVSLGPVTPTQINNANQVLAIRNSDNFPVFLQSASATPTVLVGGTSIPASQILTQYSVLSMNNNGQIIEDNGTPALYWSNSAVTAQALAGSGPSAFAINDAGQIVGAEIISDATNPGVVWTDPKTPVTLTSFGAGDYSDSGMSINANGQIVGQSVYNNAIVPVYWASLTAVPQLLALPSGVNVASVDSLGINSAGQIYATIAQGNLESVFYWSSPTATAVILPGYNTNGLNLAQAFAMNNSGVITGLLPTTTGNHAVVWKNQQLQDLNNQIPSGTGWVLTEATSINDQGVIVGVGTLTSNGATQTLAFEITPK